MPSLLFLCTGNSCRSQMAEAYAKKILGKTYDVYSAGIVKKGINPFAKAVLEEDGISLDNHASNTIEELPIKKADYIITLCGHANETCPLFPTLRRRHIGFDDPPELTKDLPNGEEKLAVYRRVRDEIKTMIPTLTSLLKPIEFTQRS